MAEQNEPRRGAAAGESEGEWEWRRRVLRGGVVGRQKKKEGDQRGQMRDLRRCLGVEEEDEVQKGR